MLRPLIRSSIIGADVYEVMSSVYLICLMIGGGLECRPDII